MDTLADLASMQHHQRMSRANSNGTRSSEGQERQIPPPPARPSLQAIARMHSGSRSSLDIHMADAPAQTPPPRAFRSSSLSDVDLAQVGQLTAYLADKPDAYESHMRLIKLLHQGLLHHVYSTTDSSAHRDPRLYDLLSDLYQAREAMASRFTLGEELWIERMFDQQLLARTLEDCSGVVELYEKAVADEAGSTTLWQMYGSWMLSMYTMTHPSDQAARQDTSNVNQWIKLSEDDQMVAAEVFDRVQLLDTWQRGADETKYNINESHLVWNKLTELKMQDVGSRPSKDAVNALENHFVERLRTPHSTWDDTFSTFSSLITKYDNSSYERIMVAVTDQAANAKAQYEAREAHELKLSQAIESGNSASVWTVFSEYLDWENSHNRKKKTFNFELANALFQRAELKFPSDTNIWEDHLALLSEESEHRKQPISSLPLLGRACGHCPWSGTLWSRYIQAAERHKLPFADIGQIKHKATSTGLLDSSSMEDVLKIHTAWCSFLRRRAFVEEATEEEPDVAEVGILSAIEDTEALGQHKYGQDYKGDPQYRLERIYIKFLDQAQKYDLARDRWKKLTVRHGNSYEFWLRYYWWEMIAWGKVAGRQSVGPASVPREATRVLQQAAKRTQLDWPEKILDTYLQHCEDHEDVAEIQIATVHWRKAMKGVAKRREGEALQASEYAEQHRQNDIVESQEQKSQVNGSKRKREGKDEDETGEATKKSRTNGTEPAGVAAAQPSTETISKRDRENTTVMVRNLPSDTNEKRVRQFFNEVRTKSH